VGAGSGAAAWLQPPSKLGGGGIEETMLSNILCDLLSNQNHPLKLTDE